MPVIKFRRSFFKLIHIRQGTLYYNVLNILLRKDLFTGVAPQKGFATIVWIHPGNFTTGSPEMWNPYTLVYRNRVIVVTFAYRLSIMGFLTTMDGEAPGNYGLQDQQAALAWVKNNINLFNGDPDNICLMGYGAGAISIGIHMVNEQSKRYFNKAISMSGDFLSTSSVKYPAEDKPLLDKLAEFFGCFRTPTSSLMECLRRADANALISFTSNINWRPLIDNNLSNSTPPFLSELPRNYFQRGDFHKIPFLTGFTDMEEVLGTDVLDIQELPEERPEEFISSVLTEIVNRDLPPISNNDSCVYNYEHITDSVLFFYGPTTPVKDVETVRKIVTDFTTEKYVGASTYLHATYISKADQLTYVYRFDMKPTTKAVVANLPEWISVPHLYDLIYVWGIPYWIQLPDNLEWDKHDRISSDIIMSFWTNFAKSSNPTETNNYYIKWETFNPENPGILIIDRNFNMSDPLKLNYKAFEFWNEYYPKVISIATQCCNATDIATIINQNQFNIYVLILVAILTTFLPFTNKFL